VVALDTSSVIHFLEGSEGADVTAVDTALSDSQACLPPVVLTELLSDPGLPAQVAELLLQIPLLGTQPGFWERAGGLRAGLLAAGRKARLADTLIAQTCIDHEVLLITRDRDFRTFGSAGLQLLP
jgi:predicted nucleic acid-binding protein